MSIPPSESPLDEALRFGPLPTIRQVSPFRRSAPVPDPTSTLVTQAEDDADQDNIQFLRSAIEATDDSSTTMSAHDQADPSHSQHSRSHSYNRLRRNNDNATQVDAQEYRRNRERMYRVMDRLQSTENPARNSGSRRTYNYGEVTPYMPLGEQEPELQEIVRELMRENVGLETQVAILVGRSRLDRERDGRAQAQDRMDQYRVAGETGTTISVNDATPPPPEHRHRRNESLRSTAIMQHARTSNTVEGPLRAIRQDPSDSTGQGGPSRDQNQNQHNTHNEDTESDSMTAWQRWSQMSRQEPNRGQSHDFTYPPTYTATRHWRREFLAAHPPNRLHHQSKPLPAVVSPWLENSIRYLDRIRDSLSYNDSLDAAMETGFANKEFFADKHDDFIMDVSQIPPPSTSSWMQSGIKFTGSQHTTPQSEPDRSTYRPLGYPHNVTWEPQQPFDATRPWLSHNPSLDFRTGEHSAAGFQALEQWPVKVTIHAVDEERMTLSGTMEAYDVPNHSNPPSSSTRSSTRDSPITTYLEGHIIDHRTHSFRTPCDEKKHHHRSSDRARTSAPASPSPSRLTNRIKFPPTTPTIDAANWRRLPPFASIEDDDEVARVFLSQDRLAEIDDQYIFMRWKERCFIHSECSTCPNSPRRGTHISGEGDDTDTGHGLTINGFYYVSLDRMTGEVQGLYYDPATSPYQCLRLEGSRASIGSGAWKFR